MTAIGAGSAAPDEPANDRSFGAALAGQIGALKRYARVLRHDPAAAEDLVQECLCRALAKRQLWQEGTDLHAWLFTMLHNLHINEIRRTARRGTHVAVEDVASSLAVLPDAPFSVWFRDFQRAVASLPEAWQQGVVLIGLEGKEYAEAAAILGLPVGTVRSRLASTREKLRSLLDESAAAPLRHGARRAAACGRFQSRPTPMRPVPTGKACDAATVSRSALAACRSTVSKPSVNRS